jgi:hypothetical protein
LQEIETEKKIIKLIEEKGPLTGSDLLAGIDDNPLWLELMIIRL